MSQGRLFEVPPEPEKLPPSGGRSLRRGEVPLGFRYKRDFITPDEEKKLLELFKKAPLHPWNYKGYESKKRVQGFIKEKGFPLALKPLFKRVAAFAGVLPSSIHHALIAEYMPGTGIGWHRDNGPYEKVIGISFGSPCLFRLRKLPQKFDPKSNKRKWEHITITAEPRSIYIMSGESHRRWQHSVAPVKDYRYSLTIRTLEK